MSREAPPSPSGMRGLERDPALVPLARDLHEVGALLERRRWDRTALLDQMNHGPSGGAGPSSR